MFLLLIAQENPAHLGASQTRVISAACSASDSCARRTYEDWYDYSHISMYCGQIQLLDTPAGIQGHSPAAYDAAHDYSHLAPPGWRTRQHTTLLQAHLATSVRAIEGRTMAPVAVRTPDKLGVKRPRTCASSRAPAYDFTYP
ncbi:hypothetical protein C8R44DRAFT_895185 [Mycena epipterygia]|nr:hypothetical protein C8R44DRAFT_895185 [Mycena epipterygia]